MQLTGRFKIRGAAAQMTALPRDRRVIIDSSGNHGIGAAHAAAAGQMLTVVLPETVKRAKLDRIRSYGVDVVLHGSKTGLTESHPQDLLRQAGMTYVSPHNDAGIVAGQGSIALKMLEQADRL